MRETGAGAEPGVEDLKVSPSWGDRLPGIEGLRGVAAFSVLVAHVALEMHLAEGLLLRGAGQLRHGLTLFFVLSGFLLFRPFVAALFGGGEAPPTGRFLRNRLVRIAPAYVVILLLVSWVLQTATLSDRSIFGGHTSTGVLPLDDTLLSLTQVQTFVPSYVLTGISPAWSLTVELTFYLLLPVVAAGAMQLRRRVPAVVAAGGAIAPFLVAGMVGKAWVQRSTDHLSDFDAYEFTWGHEWSAVLSRSILVHGDLFAFGMIVAVVYVVIERGDVGQRLRSWLSVGAVAAAAAGIGLAATAHPNGYADTGAAIAAAAVLFLVVQRRGSGEAPPLTRVLEARPLRYAGLISYSVYLWHFPIIWWVQKHDLAFADSTRGFAGNLALVGAAVVVLSSGTYLLVEQPALRLKRRTDR